MASFFTRMRSTAGAANTSAGTSPSKKDPNAPQITPLERHLVDAGPLREDGSDKFWGLENFGNTCYCNSILQCLYYSVPFREQVISYPRPTPAEAVINNPTGQIRLNTDATILPANHPSLSYSKLMNRHNTPNLSARNPGGPPMNPKPEDKENPDYKKRLAQARGPTITIDFENAAAYDMPESLFTALKDIFEALYVHQSRIGVLSPARFLEVLRRENEMFRTAMHQDAHEFLNILLNEVFTNVEVHSKKLDEGKHSRQMSSGSVEKTAFEQALATEMPESRSNNFGSVHKLFEGTLTSETRCLTCENVSQRDEAFLDLSVDLDEHTSVTSCLRKFSEEEMLCERNKFHCDRCGGLQEAEKRMKIKRLPRILALHLKRFKYTEDLQRLQKLFHRVVYPYHLRLFNTTDDAEDPDRLYELYAVVVHIGGGPYHGHYVSIIKTEDRGWLLFDDEMVEPVDKSYVQNFFGDLHGLACAYVLFYQETTSDAVKREQNAESLALAAKAVVEVPKDSTTPGLKTNGFMNGIQHVKSAVNPTIPDEGKDKLDHAITEPSHLVHVGQSHSDVTALPHMPRLAASPDDIKSKRVRAKDEKDKKLAAREAAKEEEKAERTRRKTLELKRKAMVKKADAENKAAMEASKASKVDEDHRQAAENINGVGASATSGGLGRFKSTSKSFKKKPRFFGSSSNREEAIPGGDENVALSNSYALPESPPEKSQPKPKSPFSSLRKKTSTMML